MDIRYKTLPLAIVFACSFPAVSAAQELPAKGVLLCETLHQHMMPVGGGSKNSIMETAGMCTIEQGGPVGTKVSYIVGLEFDEKGVGTLLYGGGAATHDGKVIQLRTTTEAKYILQFKDGKVVGWSSSGLGKFTAGDHAGKMHTWSAVPTGETTLRIEYAVKE